MVIRTNSWRLGLVSRLSRLVPPGLSGVFLRLYPLHVAQREQPSFEVGCSLADVTFRTPRIDMVSVWYAVRGFFDWQNVVIAATLCKPGDCIIEVGANMGTETLLFSRIVGPAGRVVAFEPLPANVTTLREQIALNNADNIELLVAAASDLGGRLRFHAPTSDENSGMGRLVSQDESPKNEIEVEALVIDELATAGKIPPPQLMALDVQGAELTVLRGAARVLAEARPAIILEVAALELGFLRVTPQQVHDFLRDAGYRAWSIGKWGLHAPDPASVGQENWLALPGRAAEGAEETARRVSRRLLRAAMLPLVPGLNPAMVSSRRS